MPFTFAEAEELPPAAKAKTEKAARWMARLSDLRKPTHVDAVSYGLQNFWRERLTGEVRCMHIFLHLSPGSSGGLQVSLHAVLLVGLESLRRFGSICSSPCPWESCSACPHQEVPCCDPLTRPSAPACSSTQTCAMAC